MAKWYDDRKRFTHVETYKGDKAMQRAVNEAGKRGWMVQSTAVKRSLFARLPWLFRPFWAKDSYVVTFNRARD